MENPSNLDHEREVKQLKELVNALRQELENSQMVLRDSLQALRQENAGEIALLKDTI